MNCRNYFGVLTVVVLALSFGQRAQADDLDLFFSLELSGSSGGGNAFGAFPGIFGSGFDTIFVSSPNGSFDGSNITSGSDDFHDFTEYMNEVNGTWSLLIDEGLPTERSFTFTVQVFVPESVLGASSVTHPTAGSSVGPDVTFQFNATTSFDGVNPLTYLEGDFLATRQGENLPGHQTQWTAPNPLPMGENFFSVYYFADLFEEDDFLIGPLVDAFDQEVEEWQFSMTRSTSNHVRFEVIPEPASLGLLAIGGLCLMSRRRV